VLGEIEREGEGERERERELTDVDGLTESVLLQLDAEQIALISFDQGSSLCPHSTAFTQNLTHKK